MAGSGPEAGGAPAPEAPSEAGGEKEVGLLAELSVPLVLAAFALYLLVGLVTMDLPEGTTFPGPRFVPAIVAAGIAVLVIAQVVTVLRQRAPLAADRVRPAGRDETEGIAGTVSRRPGIAWGSFAWAVGGFAVFSVTLPFLGWVLGAALLFWCVSRAFGSRRPLLDVVIALAVSSVAYICFDMALGLSLPSGLLGGGF
ncbi:tripartite tricarboxylate transporter TctB family protein [Brachybacterium endophyticum]|uniref:Tripartite tricarboxylate transporter TctB family protein n=1 Tax=Brachybacterium endophyticum TaxID=2182385 RepID=A0A2U2RH86_9MICO|nr:tripartite tricarboxylate transporter TctB family protein [Brachybacterium endophyticum]